MALDEVVACEVALARAAENALHGSASGWEIQAAGFRIPVTRVIDEDGLVIFFHGIMIAACDARVADLVHDGELISRRPCLLLGPCAVRWEFELGRAASRAA